VAIEIAKGNTVGEAGQVVYYNGLLVVLGVAAIAIVIVVLVASYNSLADGSG
jgi:hypothetical protein